MEKKINLNYKYMAIVFVFICFFVVIFMLSNSYALEGFGKYNLECDKTVAIGGDTITCSITGTVVSEKKISSLETMIELSDNLEFIDFKTDEIWEGDGLLGDVDLYAADNRGGTFNVGTFNVKLKDGVINSKEFIKLKDSYFYDDNFAPHTIEDTSIEIKTPQFTSDIYDFSKEYIITDTKDIATIIKSINVEDCDVIVNNNGSNVSSGSIVQGSKLVIYVGETILKEISIIYFESNIYDLSKNYVISSVSELINIPDGIEVINGTFQVVNGQLVLYYNSTGIITYDILNINSNLYKIDLNNNYIFINGEINDAILDNISKTENISLNINGDNLDITYQDGKVVKSLKIVNIYSTKYDINLDEGFIYTKGNDLSNMATTIEGNANFEVVDNKLNIGYNGKTIMDLDIISMSSSNYNINYDKGYIYTRADNTLDLIKENINLINCDIDINNGKLIVKYNGNVIDEFNLYYINSSVYKIIDNNIYIKGDMDYETFINNITFNGLSYNIYDASNSVVTSGNIGENYKIKLLIDNEELGTYTIKAEYLEFDNLSIKEDSKIIYNVVIGTTVDDLLKHIRTSGSIEVVDAEGQKLNDVIKTRSIIKITLSSTVYEYRVSVLGDLNGSGTVDPGDVAKLYQNVKKKNTFDEIDFLAGNVVNDEEIIITDVTKLYRFLKKRIPNLD